MALTLGHETVETSPAVQPPRKGSAPRRHLLDNTKLLLGIAALVASLAGLLVLASRSSTLAPDFLSEVVLYALSATNLTMLVALGFVLVRNIVKLVVERRRGLPFARFRFKLVAVLLGMTLIPAVLVLLVGSELIRNSVDRWFNQPMDEVLASANRIAGDYYQEQQGLVSVLAVRMSRSLSRFDLAGADPAVLRDAVGTDVGQGRIDLVEVYRLENSDPMRVVRVAEIVGTSMPREYVRGSADRLAQRTAAAGVESRVVEQLENRGELIRSALPIQSSPNGAVRGVVIASDYLTGHSRPVRAGSPRRTRGISSSGC